MFCIHEKFMVNYIKPKLTKLEAKHFITQNMEVNFQINKVEIY